jgi:hypothetical protein
MSGSGIPIVEDVASLANPLWDASFGAVSDAISGQGTLAPQPQQQQVTPIPEPEQPFQKRKRAASLRSKRRGRASTVLTMNDEPLGGL